MAICYKPLWKLLIDREMSKKNLMNLTNISKSTIDKMGRNEYVALEIVDRICCKMSCEIGEVIQYFPNKEQK